jgi:hypothetical protein
MLRRIAPAIGLFLFSPLIAEFLLGDLPATLILGLIILAPLYGAGALLIREVVRRRGLGWPSIVVLALAYGIIEEAYTTESLFNPDYADQHLLSYGHVHFLGLGIPWTLFVLTLHTVWSICVPIALVEGLARDRRTTPWLRTPGMIVTTVLFGIGIGVSTVVGQNSYPYNATTAQYLGAAIAVVVLIVIAFLLPRSRPGKVDASGPNPWLVGVVSLVLSSAFIALPHEWVTATQYETIVLGLDVVAIVIIWVWSRSRGWGDAQRLGLAGGALLTYAWHGFPAQPLGHVSKALDYGSNALFAALAVFLLIVSIVRLRRPAAVPERREDAVAHTR